MSQTESSNSSSVPSSTESSVIPAAAPVNTGNESTVNTPSGNTNEQVTPSYATRDQIDQVYNTMKGVVDKRFDTVNEALNQYGGVLQKLGPLADLINKQEAAGQRDPLLENPIGVVRELSQKLTLLEQQNQESQKVLTDMQNRYLANLHENSINQNFANKFPNQESFDRAKAVIATKYKNHLGALYQANGENIVAAFDQVLGLIEKGVLQDQSPEARSLSADLNRQKQMREKGQLSSIANPYGGGSQGGGAKNIFDLGSMTF